MRETSAWQPVCALPESRIKLIRLMAKEYLFVSCDIVAHSAEQSLDIQIQRVTGINRIVSEILRAAPAAGIVWCSGGDGGHVAFPVGASSQIVADYILALRDWAARGKVRLRISCSHGPAESIEGADGRADLVGRGINLAGRLIRFGSESSVLATTGFRERLAPDALPALTFHDVRLMEPKTFATQEVWLLSVEGRFKSEWSEPPVLSDRAALQAALQREEGLEIIYRARRLLEVNPSDTDAINALREMALRKLRLSAKDSSISDVFTDEQFGPDVIRAGTLVERRTGETVCEYNDEGQTMFLILKGAIGVCLPRSDSDDPAPKPDRDIVVLPGELTGELAFGLRRKRTATLRCLEDSALLSLSYAKILKTPEEQTQRDQLKSILDRKIRDRIVQYVWTQASYFSAASDPGSSSHLPAPWLLLLPNCSLTAVDWNRERTINPGHPAFPAESITILVSGRLEMTLGKSTLDGVDCPLLFVDLPGDADGLSRGYKLLEKEAKLLTIRRGGLLQLDPAAYQKVIEGIGSHLQKMAAPDSGGAGGPTTQPASKPNMKKKHVFLSYCKDDENEVTKLHDDLIAAGETVWWMKDILPGEDWKQAIRRAMKAAYAVVVCLSQKLAGRIQSGVYPEVLDAITAYRQQASGSIFLIPVRLSDCEIPDIEIDDTRTLDRLHTTDLFPETKRPAALKQLLAALGATAGHP